MGTVVRGNGRTLQRLRAAAPGKPLRIEKLQVCVFRVPTDCPESDGTLEWDSTTMVLVESSSNGHSGTGYTYAATACAALIHEKLRRIVLGMDCMDVTAIWTRMVQHVRNLGRPGVASCAISAVDVSLWDLKAKILGVPLVKLLGQSREAVSIYGSGGFTSYTFERLASQLGGWAEDGIAQVKMKIGREPERDPERVRVARQAIGPQCGLYVDANGAHTAKAALAQAAAFERYNVSWFEEPVSSDDLSGLRFVREHSPPGMEIAAGEYGYDPGYFRRMLEAGAVDVLQADATRCGGITGFIKAASLAEAFNVPLSAHTAPSLHLHPCCTVSNLRPLEYFHDHVRIEKLFFEGFRKPVSGSVRPDLSQNGFGLVLKRQDARKFQVDS